LSSKAEKLQELVQVAEAANASLGEDLWLIAERIMLFRLTRVSDQKRLELAAMVHLLRKIFTETQGEQNVPPELLQLDESANKEFKGSAEANLTLVFTTVIDTAESMSPEQLYLLISALRKMELPEPVEINVAPLDTAEEILSESFDQENEWGV
jgi:hypothetical protein